MIRGSEREGVVASRDPRWVAHDTASLRHSLPHNIRDTGNERNDLGQMDP